MTRTMFVLAALFLVVMVISFVAGIATFSAGALLLSVFVAGPLFTFCLAFGLGRASNEFVVVHKERAAAPQKVNGRVSRVEQTREREVLG